MHDKHDDGGPAFPCEDHYNKQGDFHQTGMSLRDWFAGQAIAGLAHDETLSLNQAVISAYEYADAMIAARKGGAK